jgi:glyoxylase-like metal-dependent hydrolase (beta-lactamase superfamily II)
LAPGTDRKVRDGGAGQYAGRQAGLCRDLAAAARYAREGVTRIDYLLITHFHEDHDGGAAELARRLPIGTFVDTGSPVETSADVVAAFTAYEQARRMPNQKAG